MSELTTIARPYAKAAFDYAVEKDVIDAWLGQLAFAAEVVKNDNIANLITSSSAAETLADIVIKVCDDQLDQHGQNFIKILAENGRLSALPEIFESYAELKTEHEKVINVEVTSASQLTDSQLKELAQSLEKRLEKKVKLDCNVDSALVAGLVVKANDLVIDSSVKSKLGRLSETLQA